MSTEHDTCSFMWNVTHKPFALAMSLQPNASRHSAGRVCDLMAFWPAGCPIVAYMLNNNRGSVASFSVDSVVCHFGLEQLSQFWVHSLQGQEFVDAKENVCMSQIKKKKKNWFKDLFFILLLPAFACQMLHSTWIVIVFHEPWSVCMINSIRTSEMQIVW